MRFLKRAFSLDRILGLVLLGALVALKYLDPYPVQFMRDKVFDMYQQAKPRELPPPERKPVTIIDIDEQSLSEIGQWPWPRTTIAKLIQNTMQMGAAVIAFDMVFAEPDRLSLSNVAKTAIGLDDETRKKLETAQSNDEILANVIKRSRVVLGQAGRQRARRTGRR
jgi:adenylate cyclase